MQLDKRQTYFAILAAVVVVCLLYQSVWIFSRTTTAKIYSVTNSYSGRRGINSMNASYIVDYKTYSGSFLQDGFNPANPFFKVRYLIFNPDLARSDRFISNWGPLILFFLICFLITSIAFIRKDIISNHAIFLFQKSRPFISVKNNSITDFDEHIIENKIPDEKEEALKLKIRKERNEGITGEINASIYKYNPNAIAIIVVYIFYFFWFFYAFLSGHLTMTETIIFGAILIFVPSYVKYTNNPVFKMEIPDEGSLVFSSRGILYRQIMYPVGNIESAVVYLESFRGFVYRDRTTFGSKNTVSTGDNNKMSFRCRREITDLTFILYSSTDYWAFRNLMTTWASGGINVVLQRVFKDDFIIQEMAHFYSLAQ
jgi:hypothetical protein